MRADSTIDISRHAPKRLTQVPNLDHYQIVVGLAREAQRALPPPSKTVYLDWNVEDPSRVKGTAAEVQAAYEKTYQSLNAHIRDLVEAILGDKVD